MIFILMLKITISLQIFIANKILIVNKTSKIQDSDKSIEKLIELKIRKLSKSAKIKKKVVKKLEFI